VLSGFNDVRLCVTQPITTPGSVQAFGVLMVLEENYDTDDLLVRQVSEVSHDPAVASAHVELKHRRYLTEFHRSAGNVSEISI